MYVFSSSSWNSLLKFRQCFFDNTVFAPFIFIEDPDYVPVKSHLGESISRFNTGSSSLPSSSVLASGSSNLLSKSNKVDPYYLITQVSYVTSI